MLQLHLSDQLFHYLPRCGLYQMFDGIISNGTIILVFYLKAKSQQLVWRSGHPLISSTGLLSSNDLQWVHWSLHDRVAGQHQSYGCLATYPIDYDYWSRWICSQYRLLSHCWWCLSLYHSIVVVIDSSFFPSWYVICMVFVGANVYLCHEYII